MSDNQANETAAGLERRIDDLRRGEGSRLPYCSEAQLFAQELSSIREALVRVAEQGHPEEAARLMERLIDSAEATVGRVDDSPGCITPEVRMAVREWGVIWAMMEARRPEDLAGLVLRHALRNDYGLKDEIVSAFSAALGTEGLGELKRSIREKLEGMPAGGDGEEWSEERHAHSCVALLLKDTVDCLGDVDEYARVCEEQGWLDLDAEAIAGKLLAASRPAEALEFLDAHTTERTRLYGKDLPGVRSKILLELGRNDEAVRALLQGFAETLSERYLGGALKLTPEAGRAKLEQDALDRIGEFEDAEAALCFLARRGALDRAAALVDRRLTEIDAGWYDGIRESARRLAGDHPKQAWLLLRVLLLDILKAARSKAYRHGVRYLEDMAGLAKRGGFAGEHEDLVAQLHKNHGRKRAFWKKLESRS